MKYLILMLTISLTLVAISCSESSDTTKINENIGNEGYNCKEDKTCNDKLICNRNNICEKDVSDGKVGTINNPCRTDKSCDSGLVCNANNICEKEGVENIGKEGFACKADKSCDSGLICNTDSICEKDVDNVGKEGFACKADKSCDSGLICNTDNICEKEVDNTGKEGFACGVERACDYDLFCNTDDICEKNDVVDFGKEGKPCIKVGDEKCLEDYLICNEYDICTRFEGEAGVEGNPCKTDGSCNEGLMCALENICLNEYDFNTGDEGQDCRVTNESMEYCYDGLSCDINGNCEMTCEPGNDSLCDNNGEFDYSLYAGKYKLIRFDETMECGSNNYIPKTNLDYEYFQLVFESDFGHKRLTYHSCENLGTCSYSKSYYKILFEGVQYADENDDGSCTYGEIISNIRMEGNKVRIRYTFSEVTLSDSADECSSLNVHSHWGELECVKTRIIDGIKQ